MTQHYLLGPSSAPRWVNCPGSLFGPELIEEDSVYAREGTACHNLLEFCLLYGADPNLMLGQVLSDPDFPVDQGMADAVTLFIDTVKAECELQQVDFSLSHAEITLTHSREDLSDIFGGTCDYYVAGDDTLIVADLKYGRKPVYANSEQLTAYTLLILSHLNRPFNKIVQFLIQPKINNIDRFEVGIDDLTRVWAGVERAGELVNHLVLTDPPPADTLATGSHCEYCRRKITCPEFGKLVTEVTDIGTAEQEDGTIAVPPSATSRTTEDLLRLDAVGDAVNRFFKEVNSQLLHRASNGEPVPGKKLCISWGHRKWTDSEDVLFKRLPRLLGLKLKDLKEVGLCSPAKVESLLRAAGTLKDKQKKLDELAKSPKRGVCLKDERAKGETVLPESAIDFLKNMTNEEEHE